MARAQTATRFGQGTTHESLHLSLYTEYNANTTNTLNQTGISLVDQHSIKPNIFTSINGCKSNLEL